MLRSSSIIILKNDIMSFAATFKLEDLLEYLYIDSVDEIIFVENILDDLCAENKLVKNGNRGYTRV